MATADKVASLGQFEEVRKGKSLWQDAFERLARNRMAMFGLIVIILFVLMALFASVLAPMDPNRQTLEDNYAAPQWVIDLFPVMKSVEDGGYVRVSDKYAIGADSLGRDLLSRIIFGARISLAVAFIGPIVSIAIGLSLGLIAGFYGGLADSVVMRIVDVFYAFPTLLIIILMMAYFRGAFSEAPTVDTFIRPVVLTGFDPDGSYDIIIRRESTKLFETGVPRAADASGNLSVEALNNQKLRREGEYTVSVRSADGGTVLAGSFVIGENSTAETTTVVFDDPAFGGEVQAQVEPTLLNRASYAIYELDRAMGGMLFIFIGIGLTSWVGMARLTRGQVLSVREMDYITAARSLGAGQRSIMSRHILPNILGPIIVSETLTIPSYIRYEAFLSFIGLGVNRPTPSWGSMISDGARDISSYPNQAIFPAIALGIVMFAFNFLGDGLRDAFDPRMRGVD
jgi:ABC-type dipeptide/oligopeptide/nickel transport system permease subunit